MPFPIAVAAIPWLAGFFGTLFGSIVAKLTEFVGKKFAAWIVVTGSLFAFTALYFGACYVAMQMVQVVAPPSVSYGLSLALPSNTTICISAYLAAKTARWVYIWKTRTIQFTMGF